VAEHNLAPLGQPDVEITRLEDGDVVEFVAEVDVRPDFDMPDFPAGIAVEVEDHTVTDDEVDERIELLRKRFSTKTDVERAAPRAIW
jgi:trigger factor